MTTAWKGPCVYAFQSLPSDFSFVLSVPVQLSRLWLFRQFRMWVESGWRITKDINLAGQCVLALPPCCFGIYAHCLHREHGRGPPINAIIFANAAPASLLGSRRLMTKIKVCCTNTESINQRKLLPQSGPIQPFSSGSPQTWRRFQPPSPNLYYPALVPRQVSAYKFENDLSCPLNNRWECRVRVPSINSIPTLISELKKKKGKKKTAGLLRTLALAPH